MQEEHPITYRVGKNLTEQHMVLILDVHLTHHKHKTRHDTNPRITWRSTIDFQKMIEGNLGLQGSTNLIWDEMPKNVTKAANAVLGESKDFGPKDKEFY